MDRRTFLKSASLVSAGSLVPEFLARAAEKAKPGADRILVVVEMTGGNDGLNMVIPHADDHYYKARPTLAIPKNRVLRIDDNVGLHPQLFGLQNLLQKRELAVVLGVGYPNPNRSHFESMDIWQSADPKHATKTGWLGRSLPGMKAPKSGLLAMHVAPTTLPLALQDAAGVVSLNDPSSFSLQFTGNPETAGKRKKLLESLSAPSGTDDLTAFIRRRQVQVLGTTESIEKALKNPKAKGTTGAVSSLYEQLQLVARLIASDAGARIYYTMIDGFDTHARQAQTHGDLLSQVGNAVQQFFTTLSQSGQSKRVVLLTYSEFGRRVQENGAKGTDHGAASHLFVVGPAVKSGMVGSYPRLDDLTAGDMKFGIDFRRVYATLLDNWLGCDSKTILNGTFEHLPLLARS